MFLFDENVEPKRSQGQRVAAKDLRVLNMARKVGILLAAEAYLLEKEYAKRTTPPQKKHVFFRSGRVFPCHIIMYSYMYIYIYCRGKTSFGWDITGPGSNRQVPAIPRQIQSGLRHVLSRGFANGHVLKVMDRKKMISKR